MKQKTQQDSPELQPEELNENFNTNVPDQPNN